MMLPLLVFLLVKMELEYLKILGLLSRLIKCMVVILLVEIGFLKVDFLDMLGI